MFCNTSSFDEFFLRTTCSLIPLKNPMRKNRNNLTSDYSIMNRQGLKSNPCLILSLETSPWGKYEIRNMLVSISLIKNFV
jgi:hypothetical protein